MAEEKFIKKLVFRFISKHIAGATLNSALNTAKMLNSKGLGTTITFLNDHIHDSVRARYNLNSYVQLTKQISRLNLRSAISVRLSQLGFNVSEDTAINNVRRLSEVASPLRIPVWIEHESSLDLSRVARSYSRYAGRCPNLGIELPVRSPSLERIISALPKRDCMVKLTAHPIQGGRRTDGSQKQKTQDVAALYTKYARLLGKRHKVYIRENDEKALYRIANNAGIPKSNLIVELPLGYSGKWLNRFTKKRFNIDVYVPYGKDWVPYAINRLSEGRIKSIATSILNGESEVGLNGREQGE